MIPELDEVVKVVGLDVGLIGLAVTLSLLLRLGRASWVWFNDPHTLLAGLLFGIAGAALKLSMGSHVWQEIALQGIALGVVVLVGERILRKLSGKFGLPADNAYVKPETEEKQ